MEEGSRALTQLFQAEYCRRKSFSIGEMNVDDDRIAVGRYDNEEDAAIDYARAGWQNK